MIQIACGTDAVLLPENFNEQKVKVVDIDYRVELAPIESRAGLQGGPAPTITGDLPLTENFLKAGADIVRLPQGYLCDYTLSGIFPVPDADPAKPESYAFGKIDTVVGAASSVASVVFQATWDVGITSCSVGADGDQTGQPPADISLWTTVVVNTLRHFNKGLLVESNPADQPWIADARSHNVRAVEFIDDPMGRGGYTDVGKVVTDFVAMAEAVKAAFPNDGQGDPVLKVVGPAMTIASAASLPTHAIVAFMDQLVALGKGDLLDALSIQTAVEFPYENKVIADALRAAMDDRGLSGAELWVTRYEPDPTIFLEPTNVLDVPSWSLVSGAFATATRILWQGTVDQAFFYRGDRRHRSVDGTDILAAEKSPLWSGTGEWQPAGIAWQPWLIMGGKVRLQVEPPEQVDQNGLAVLSGKDVNATCSDDATRTCARIWVLIANSNTHLSQKQLSYQIRVKGVTATEDASRQVIVRHSIINEGTGEFAYEPLDLVPLVGTDFFYQLESSVPAVDFIEVELTQ